MANGIFITIEGPDGAGKSTQIDLLKQYFLEKGYDVLLTRDPGGNRISEEIRGIILNKDYTEMAAETELLLYTAARAQLVKEIIEPALNEGKVVISDRFVDSAAVYQGMGRGLGVDTVYQVNDCILKNLHFDMTILLDLPAEEGIRRKKNQAELDRMERESLEFHKKVAEGYRKLKDMNPDRIFAVNATLPIEVIHDTIRKEVEQRYFS